MPRATPSNWQPKGIELFEVRPLYNSRQRLELLRHLGAASASREKQTQLLNRSMNAAAWLRSELHYAKKPGRSQAAAAIQPLNGAAKMAAKMLLGLDYQSRELIERAADEDDIANTRRADEMPRMRRPVTIGGKTEWHENFLGRERLNAVARALSDLERWAGAAPSLCPDREAPKTARKKSIRAAIEALADTWREAWAGREHADPKLAQFLPFVQAVVNPILAEDGSPEDLRRATEDVLHGAQGVGSTDEVQAMYPSGGTA